MIQYKNKSVINDQHKIGLRFTSARLHLFTSFCYKTVLFFLAVCTNLAKNHVSYRPCLTQWLPWVVTGGYPENGFQYRDRHRWVTGLYHIYGGSNFMEWNNVFLTPQPGQEICMKFWAPPVSVVHTVRVLNFCYQCRVRVTGGPWDEI
jgi:hypothetical protein